MLLASLLIAVAAYLLGSIPTGYLLMLFFRHQDIRAVGSGNIGATNVLARGRQRAGRGNLLSRYAEGLRRGLAGHAHLDQHDLYAHVVPHPPLRNFQALAALCAFSATCSRCGSNFAEAKA